MSYIDTIRNVAPRNQKSFKPRHIEASTVEYKPMFLKKALSGSFTMSNETLELEIMECMRKEKRDFYTFLKENNLSIKKSIIPDHVVIFR